MKYLNNSFYEYFRNMNNYINVVKFLLVFLFLNVVGNKIIVANAPINVIYETDMGNDVDDALALDILYKYHHEGKINLLAIMLNKEGVYPIEFVDIMNTWYGFPDIPIGKISKGAYCENDGVNYAKSVSTMKDSKGNFKYRRTYCNYDSLLEATDLYRKILSEQKDTSVVIISVGFSTNLSRLLHSKPDKYSSLAGKELIKKKVKYLSTMAGCFNDEDFSEYNIYKDLTASIDVFKNWPTQIVVSPNEVGVSIMFPGESIIRDFNWTDSHPVVDAYKSFLPMPYDRPSWDLTSVLYVVEGNKYFNVSKLGLVDIKEKGQTIFIPNVKGNRCYLSVDSLQSEIIKRYFVNTITTPLYEFPKNSNQSVWIGKSADFSHGKLEVSDNKRFLQYEDGTPFFYLGDTAWELFHRLNKQEVEGYLENRRSKGFNVIQAVVFAELDGLNSPDRYGNKPLYNNSLDSPNLKYFQWVDSVIRMAETKGLYLGLLPTWGDKVDKQWGVGPEIFNEKNAYLYGKWIGERYKDYPNIIWIIGGDRLGGGKNYKIWEALACGIKSVDKNHLMSFHPIGEHSSSEWFHEEKWLDFNMAQTGHRQQDYAIYEKIIKRDYDKFPVKPCMDSEPRYENHPISWEPDSLGWFDSVDVRKALYWSLFSGSLGHTYGCHDIWQMKSVEYESVGFARGNWYSSLELEGAGDMIHARRLMEGLSWEERRPAYDIVISPNEDLNNKVVALRGKGYVLIYIPNNQEIICDLSHMGYGKELSVKWMNPRNGIFFNEGSCKSSSSVNFKTPTKGRGNDWILLIQER